MSDVNDALFQFNHSRPGRVRSARLADAAGVDLKALSAPSLHRLERALESGFRTSALRLFDGFDEPERWRKALDEMPKRWWFIRGDLEVVVTGFGPFQAHAHNPSKPFAQAVAAGVSKRLASSYEGLQVTYKEVREFVDLQDYGSQPVLVHCGLAQERATIALERYAHNIRGETLDNSGEPVDQDWVVPGGPTALETFMPIDRIASDLSDRLDGSTGVDAKVSQDAGTYVCNALYYRSLMAVRQARLADRAAEAIFVHIPNFDVDTARKHGRRIGDQLGQFLEAGLNDQSSRKLE